METMDKKHWVIDMSRGNGNSSQQGFYGSWEEVIEFAEWLQRVCQCLTKVRER